MTDCVYQIGTIQGKYQPDGILGYIGDDYILESLGGQSTFTFSVPQNEDPITDASFTQSSLGKAAKHRMFVARFFLIWFIIQIYSRLEMKRLMVSRLDRQRH